MTCDDFFRDGDNTLHRCLRSASHDGLHNDGKGCRWNGTWVGTERGEDQ